MIKKENSNNLERIIKSKNYQKCKFNDQQTSSDTPKKTSFKQRFTQWLKQLPLDQRYLAVKVKAPGLAKKIQEALIDLQNDQSQQKTKESQQIKISTKQSKQIIDSIVLISDGQQYFDNIGFDFSYIQHPQKLFDLLTICMNQTQRQMLQKQQSLLCAKNLNQLLKIVHNSNSKEDVLIEVINWLRYEIFNNFQSNKSLNLEEQRNRKKEFSVFWRNLTQQQKTRILMLHKDDTKAVMIHLAEQNIFLDQNQIEKQINDLIKLQKNQFCNKIFKCKLKRSLTYFNQYYELIYKAWKQELQKKKRRSKNKRNLILQKCLSNPKIQVPKGAQIQHLLTKKVQSAQQAVQKPAMKRKRNRNRHKKSTSAQSKQTKATNYKFQAQTMGQDNENNQNQEQKQQLKDEVIGLLANNEKIPKLEIPFIDFQSEIIAQVSQYIQEYSDLINQQANQFYDRRVVAYQRIQFMLSLWKVPIKLFGSCASGITIKNSDIDIAVDNSILNYFIAMPQHLRLRAALEQLQQFLQQQPWVTSLKLIKTASIPLIKMKVNTSIKFTEISGSQLYPQYIESLNRQHNSSGQIHIDLTIQTMNKDLQCNHLGIISTDWINKQLQSTKSLHSIIVLIKNFLTQANLNVTYQGGINTYSMICMLVAFIKHKAMQNQTNQAITLRDLSKFYAYQFNQKTTGIDLEADDIFYQKIQQMTKSLANLDQMPQVPVLSHSKSVNYGQADLEIKDPLNQGKIMTRNCYSFPKIKQIFMKIYEECFIKAQKCLKDSFAANFESKIQEFEVLRQNPKQMKQKIQQVLKQSKSQLQNSLLTLFN